MIPGLFLWKLQKPKKIGVSTNHIPVRICWSWGRLRVTKCFLLLWPKFVHRKLVPKVQCLTFIALKCYHGQLQLSRSLCMMGQISKTLYLYSGPWKLQVFPVLPFLTFHPNPFCVNNWLSLLVIFLVPSIKINKYKTDEEKNRTKLRPWDTCNLVEEMVPTKREEENRQQWVHDDVLHLKSCNHVDLQKRKMRAMNFRDDSHTSQYSDAWEKPSLLQQGTVEIREVWKSQNKM